MVNVAVLGFRQEEDAKDCGHQRHDDRIPETVVDVAGRSHHGKGSGRQEAAEPAIADVIRQGHRGVANAGREQLDQPGRNRTVNHGHVEHQQGQQYQHHRLVDLVRISLGRITRRLDRTRQPSCRTRRSASSTHPWTVPCLRRS